MRRKNVSPIPTSKFIPEQSTLSSAWPKCLSLDGRNYSLFFAAAFAQRRGPSQIRHARAVAADNAVSGILSESDYRFAKDNAPTVLAELAGGNWLNFQNKLRVGTAINALLTDPDKVVKYFDLLLEAAKTLPVEDRSDDDLVNTILVGLAEPTPESSGIDAKQRVDKLLDVHQYRFERNGKVYTNALRCIVLTQNIEGSGLSMARRGKLFNEPIHGRERVVSCLLRNLTSNNSRYRDEAVEALQYVCWIDAVSALTVRDELKGYLAKPSFSLRSTKLVNSLGENEGDVEQRFRANVERCLREAEEAISYYAEQDAEKDKTAAKQERK